MAQYSSPSPYSQTKLNSLYLDVANLPNIALDGAEIVVSLPARYSRRPDLMSFELYGTSKLWWIFAAVNPDTVTDPIYDFVEGTTIIVPSQASVKRFI